MRLPAGFLTGGVWGEKDLSQPKGIELAREAFIQVVFSSPGFLAPSLWKLKIILQITEYQRKLQPKRASS